MLVSIITITYNSEKYLEQTINSVLSQSYKNIEYIVIDGGSTDKTLEIINKYRAKITKFISEPDNGISDAMNKGINLATGDIIGLIHSDDWYESDAVEKIVKKHSKGDVFHGNVQYWKENTKDYLFSANHNLLPKEMTINHMSVFVKREIYQKFGNFRLDMKYAMDYELMLRFYTNGAKFYYISETLANMRLEGASDKNWKKAIKETFDAKIINNQSWLFCYIYYLKQLTRTTISKFLIKYNMQKVVSFYRKWFAITKKQ